MIAWAVTAVLSAALAHAGAEGLPESAHVEFPAGEAPEDGWPVFVLLHGYGTNKDDFAELCRVVASRGAVAVALDAPHRVRGAQRSWGRPDNNTRVHEYVQEHLASIGGDPRIDARRVHLGGFSQGAMHAVLLTLHWPAAYGGVLAVSSPGKAALPQHWEADDRAHPLFLVYGQQEPASVATFADRLARLWDASGQRHQTFRHPGGHTFPLFWERIFAGAVDWILDPKA